MGVRMGPRAKCQFSACGHEFVVRRLRTCRCSSLLYCPCAPPSVHPQRVVCAPLYKCRIPLRIGKRSRDDARRAPLGEQESRSRGKMHRLKSVDRGQVTGLSDPVLRALLLVIDLFDDLLELEVHPADRAVLLSLRNRAEWLATGKNRAG